MKLFLAVTKWLGVAGGGVLLLSAAGCITGPSRPAATQPATAIEPAQADPLYWYRQPAVVAVRDANYERLWSAAQSVARDYFFTLDREDYREGVLTTLPLTSMQWFEFWRRDVVTVNDLARSSLQTLRRTIHFKVEKDPDGGYRLSPKVLIEQYATVGQRLTYVGYYTRASDVGRQVGSVEMDEGQANPPQYWFAIGRDHALEKRLAESIRHELAKTTRQATADAANP